MCDLRYLRDVYGEDMSPRRTSKTEFLQVRLTPEDKERIVEAATAEHLEPSTWARQVILRALDDRQK